MKLRRSRFFSVEALESRLVPSGGTVAGHFVSALSHAAHVKHPAKPLSAHTAVGQINLEFDQFTRDFIAARQTYNATILSPPSVSPAVVQAAQASAMAAQAAATAAQSAASATLAALNNDPASQSYVSALAVAKELAAASASAQLLVLAAASTPSIQSQAQSAANQLSTAAQDAQVAAQEAMKVATSSATLDAATSAAIAAQSASAAATAAGSVNGALNDASTSASAAHEAFARYTQERIYQLAQQVAGTYFQVQTASTGSHGSKITISHHSNQIPGYVGTKLISASAAGKLVNGTLANSLIAAIPGASAGQTEVSYDNQGQDAAIAASRGTILNGLATLQTLRIGNSHK